MGPRLYDAHNHLQDARLAPHREAILAALQREGVAGMVVNGSCEEDWPQVLKLARQFRARAAGCVAQRGAGGTARCTSQDAGNWAASRGALGQRALPSGAGTTGATRAASGGYLFPVDRAEHEPSAPARGYPRVIPSFGYHPWYVKDQTPDWQQAMVRYLDAVPSAVGEIGLDRWIKDYDFEQQQQVFVWQLRLAAERNLPVSIHCLQAWGPLLDILRAEPRPRCGFLLHSYGGAPELVAPLANSNSLPR